jgi:hypothetical protein
MTIIRDLNHHAAAFLSYAEGVEKAGLNVMASEFKNDALILRSAAAVIDNSEYHAEGAMETLEMAATLTSNCSLALSKELGQLINNKKVA